MNSVDAPIATATTLPPGTKGNVEAGAKVASSSERVAPAGNLTPQAPPDLNAAVHAAVQQIDSYLKSVGREVEFRVDDVTGMTVVTVRATATGDVIRQIPNEEVLQLARHLTTGAGVLLDLSV